MLSDVAQGWQAGDVKLETVVKTVNRVSEQVISDYGTRLREIIGEPGVEVELFLSVRKAVERQILAPCLLLLYDELEATMPSAQRNFWSKHQPLLNGISQECLGIRP